MRGILTPKRLCGPILLLWITGAAYAQKPIEETVIVSATSYPVPFTNLARKVTVLDHEQIARLPVRSVPELLRYAASVEVRARGPLGVQADFSVRGAGFGQVLVLVNGIRLNDSQSGHHNSDIPVLLQDVDRVEILYGPGSSLYGADAFGGTINIITRQQESRNRAHFSAGDFGLVDGSAGLKLEKNGIRQFFSAFANRSSGFMFDRDFRTVGLTSQTYFGERSFLFISHLGKEFGANGFYGESPSKEWTNQTLLSFDHQLLVKQWNVTGQTFYRTHGDHFLWDIRRPGFFENRHRTHAVGGLAKAQRSLSDQTQLTVGVEVGGDWIGSNNLGDHAYSRGSGFAELQLKLGDRGVIYPGIRYDHYSNFGSSTSPSLSAAWWFSPTVKLRSSVGHAFRIPTFTERYYRDPRHQAISSLNPEKAWGAEAGVEWLPQPNWMAGLTLFSRWERDVIDWVRENPTLKWNTTNIHDLRTRGVEANIQQFLDSGGQLGFQYTYLSSDASLVPVLESKYVLDFARHSFSAFGSFRLPWSLTLGQRVDYKRRADGRSYWVLDGRLKRPFGKFNFYVECTNMLNTGYQEIPGVQMPPRWVSAGLEIAGL